MVRDVSVILLYDTEKKILLQDRDDDAQSLPGYWAFFGGGIEEGETPEQALERESFEELNHKPSNYRQIMVQKFHGKTPGCTKYVFVEECTDKSHLILQEGRGWGWFTISEALSLKIADHDKEVLEYIQREGILKRL